MTIPKKYFFCGAAVLAMALLTLSGCMLGPDHQRPETLLDEATGFHYGRNVVTDANAAVTLQGWWESFNDPQTTALVEQALADNTDIAAAAARYLAAEAAYRQVHGTRLPQVDYGFSATRSRTPFEGADGWDHSYSTTLDHGISVVYITDLFGRLRRNEEAAWREVQQAQAAQEAVVHAIVAGVVSLRVEIATQQQLSDIARANTASRQRTLEIAEQRYSQGLVEPVDVRLARENLASSQVQEAVVELRLRQAALSLDVLLNRKPGEEIPATGTLAALPDLAAIPAGLPVDLLEQRPDIREAEMRLAAATARIGAALAEMYPDLTLTASGGFRSDELALLVQREALIYSAVASLAQPIFRGGQLRAQVDAARAQADAAAADYAGVVVAALRDVEDALVREQIIREQLSLLELRLQEGLAAERLSRDRYERGVGSLLLVLETERRRRLAENDLAAAKGALWRARVDLFLALGGDWVEETPLAQTEHRASEPQG